MFLGLASFVVWTQGGFQEQTGNLALYAINLALNLAWMPVSLSFHLHRGRLYTVRLLYLICMENQPGICCRRA